MLHIREDVREAAIETAKSGVHRVDAGTAQTFVEHGVSEPVLNFVSWCLSGWDNWNIALLIICVCAVYFTLGGLVDLQRFLWPVHSSSKSADDNSSEIAGSGSERQSSQLSPSQPGWSVGGIVGLCALRYYTGFLSATWMPYLLAMEGQAIFGPRQALFMALAKLIYGLMVLLNPVFGLIGDVATTVSHGRGRRLFLRSGVAIAAFGIYVCVLAGRQRSMPIFLGGIALWRFGETLNDITTEALVPEMIPKEQFQVASAIKSVAFLIGGLVGYVFLLFFADVPYAWLYYAYPLGMFICVLPSIYLLDNDRPLRARVVGRSWKEFFVESYVAPAYHEGGFPMACLSITLYGLGTSPMFFILLLVRDLVGIANPTEAQRSFSVASLFFFLSAAVATIVISAVGPKKSPRPEEGNGQERTAIGTLLARRNIGFVVLLSGAVSISLLPTCVFFENRNHREWYFMIITGLFGASFGAAFSFGQELNWTTLPPKSNLACSMGFNLMCRLMGVGLGNCLCGFILEITFSGRQNAFGIDVYETSSYFVMCAISALVMMGAAVCMVLSLNQHIALIKKQEEGEEQSSQH